MKVKLKMNQVNNILMQLALIHLLFKIRILKIQKIKKLIIYITS